MPKTKNIWDVFYINDEFFIYPIIDKIKNKEEYKRLFSNFISLSVLQAANYILPLITLPYLVRVLGPEKYGLVSFAQAFIGYFMILTDYGFNLSATREISINRDNKEKLSEIFSSVMTIKAGLLIVSFVLMSIIVFSFGKFSRDWPIYYLTFGMVLGQVLFPVWFFQGMERMKYITVLNITAKLIFTVAIFVFVHSEFDYLKVPLLNSAGYLIAGVISLYVLKKNFKPDFKFYNFKKLKEYFKDSTQFFLSRVSVSIYTSSNSFVLGLFTNNTMVGYYSIAEKLYQAVQYLYAPLNQVLYPYVSNSKNINLFKKIFKTVVIVNIIFVLIVFLFSNNLFNLLFSDRATLESVKVFNIFLIATIVVVPSVLIGYPLLGGMGHPEYANKSVIYGSMVHLIGLLILILIGKINPIAVAFMVVITESSVFFMRNHWVKNIAYE